MSKTLVKIAALNIYPVKSCRGIALDDTMLTTTGLAQDRHWMLVDDNGRFVTQRNLPQMALIEPVLDDEGLQLSAPGMPDLFIPDENGREHREVIVWRDRCRAIDEGEHAAEWLSAFLGESVRLVHFDPQQQRASSAEWTGELEALNEFSDGFPILVIGDASLEDLNQRLPSPLPMNRFRPNVVLSGLGAYDEDKVFELTSGRVRLRLVKPCTRCKITTTDQSTGEALGSEPLMTLKSYRWNPQLKGVTFGQNAIVAQGVGALLKVGDEFEITWR